MTEENVFLDVLDVLVSNDRSELSKAFGVGLYISEEDDVEQVIAKCETYITRYKGYIDNLNFVINSKETLASEMRKAKAKRYIKSLSLEEKAELKSLLEI